jgi:CxxC-x17-CxxC domain-containing protein
MEFVDRLLTCSDCGCEFIFTAGEQLFFFDKQFKNDPKRCKPCKSKRGGAGVAPGSGPAAAGLSRTETRTHCSECGVETTVPFKPTQGRPVLCRQCFQNKRAATDGALVTAAVTVDMVSTGPVGDHPTPGTDIMAAAARASQA